MASVSAFQQFLQDHDTATAAIVAWCRRHQPGSGDDLAARVLLDREADPGDYDGLLQLDAGEPIRCRRVLLTWGNQVVSEAENWYFPRRLPREMQTALTGSEPFGAVVAGLAPRRTTIAVHTSDDILKGGKAVESCLAELERAAVFSPVEAFVLHVTAVMEASGVVLAELREHYRRELLAF
ncbi:hypothetical protein HNR60_001981 [Rhodopseudomonas rhenobacensis]|uniref:Uncharacterized protein n=1 Tax=Rhodopseudomonas rhenobacensis TaxID=87461 RepID=A0A7W7Z3F6_9BRAD|nr:hypothetical protein [Rhodopseudomonas rhenobacensis]MBB5047229.1 hypothetical protein [Rhodopseudomonas rhenobacensis]